MAVLLVVTEHSSYLDRRAVRRYEIVRRRLEDVFGTTVTSAHYEDIESIGNVHAVVLSGSRAPWATHDRGALERLRENVSRLERPVLGICAGMQLQAMFAGGRVGTAARADRGYRAIEVLEDGDLFRGVPARPVVYQHHTDEIVALPDGFRVLARSAGCAVEAIADLGRRWWGTQFHPERFDAEHPAGEQVLRNFFEVAGIRR